MAESAKITLVSESMRYIEDMAESVTDIWRHEGLKKAVEFGLYHASQQEIGRRALEAWADPLVDPSLRTSVDDITLDGLVGIAPGWDKPGTSIQGWQALGAKHLTVGGVTLDPQTGKQMVRLRTFDERIGDHGKTKSLNSFGFNSQGAPQVTRNIGEQRELAEVTMPVIVQITANKEMYEEANKDQLPAVLARTALQVLPVADAIGFGLSSFNTPGMRESQGYEFLKRIIGTTQEAVDAATNRYISYVFKGDADGREERLDTYCRLMQEMGICIELINSTGLKRIKDKYGAGDLPGGLAGSDPEFQQMAEDAVRYVWEATGGNIIGVGGINSPSQAFKMIRAGASAVSINTGVRTLGLRAPTILERGISDIVTKQGITSIDELIGIDTLRGSKAQMNRQKRTSWQ